MNRTSPAHTRSHAAPKAPASAALHATKYITSGVELQKWLSQGSAAIVGVHFQFTREKSRQPGKYDDELVAIGVVGPNSLDDAVVLHLDSSNQAQVLLALKTLLSDPATVKVMHNIHRAAFFLHSCGLTDVQLVNCVDLQIVYENFISTFELDASMLQIVEQCNSTAHSSTMAQTTQSFKSRVKLIDSNEWARRPLPETLLSTLTNNAQLYAQCYVELVKVFASVAACNELNNARWQNAIENEGCKAIWFYPAADNQPRSLECLVFNGAGTSATRDVNVLPLELQCELEPLLKILPADYRDAIVAVNDYRTKLVDVCLDVGRIPYVYTGKEQRVVLSKNNEVVSKDTIDEINRNLGGEMRIGNDNRAGINRQLHCISVMRTTVSPCELAELCAMLRVYSPIYFSASDTPTSRCWYWATLEVAKPR